MGKFLSKNTFFLTLLFIIFLIYNLLSNMSVWMTPLFGFYLILYIECLESDHLDVLFFLTALILVVEIEYGLMIFSIPVLYTFIYIFLLKRIKIFIINKTILYFILIAMVYIFIYFYINILSLIFNMHIYYDLNILFTIYYIVLDFLFQVVLND